MQTLPTLSRPTRREVSASGYSVRSDARQAMSYRAHQRGRPPFVAREMREKPIYSSRYVDRGYLASTFGGAHPVPNSYATRYYLDRRYQRRVYGIANRSKTRVGPHGPLGMSFEHCPLALKGSLWNSWILTTLCSWLGPRGKCSRRFRSQATAVTCLRIPK